MVAGSLGKGNASDDAILQAFLDEHACNFASVIVLTHDPRLWQDPSITELPPPGEWRMDAEALGRSVDAHEEAIWS